MDIKQLEPVEVVRDEYGCWMHPEFREYLDKHHYNQEQLSEDEWESLKRHFNIQTVNFYLDGSVSPDDWEQMMDEPNLSKWDPIWPDGFFLIDIGFTEDDAIAIFAREISDGSEVV